MGQLIIISKVQYVTSNNLIMRFNIFICIFLPRSYNLLVFYHVNIFLQFNFNSINICGSGCFPNFNISLHSLLDIPIWSQCNHIFHLLSNHPNLYIFFFHDTSNAICKLSSSLLISCTIPCFHSSVHITKRQKFPKQNKDTS